MPLVETSSVRNVCRHARACLHFVRQIDKTPIVVQDARGFYTSRVFSTYVMEGAQLLLEGQHPRSIEVAGQVAGMPVGPLALLDEVNMGTVARIEAQNRKDAESAGSKAPSHPGSSAVARMVELKRPGKKEKHGFYDYPEGQSKKLWPELDKHFPLADKTISQDEMVSACCFAQATRRECFAEGVVQLGRGCQHRIHLGWGFAPSTVARCSSSTPSVCRASCASRELAAAYGARFEPAANLADMAEKGAKFDA